MMILVFLELAQLIMTLLKYIIIIVHVYSFNQCVSSVGTNEKTVECYDQFVIHVCCIA